MDNFNFPHPSVPAAPLLPPNNPEPLPDHFAQIHGDGDFFTDARSPMSDPTVVRDMQAAVQASVQTTQIGEPESDRVELPIPFLISGQSVTSATVRELNGGHEEAIIKAMVGREPEQVIDVILQSGIVAFGNFTPNAADILELATANRNALLIGIRIVTYGKMLTFDELSCNKCAQRLHVEYDLTEIPQSKGNGKPGGDTVVNLRKGGYAILRQPNGADVAMLLSEIRERDINKAEQDTIMIARCLKGIKNTDGTDVKLNGLETARQLSMADRAAITKAMDENTRGPKLTEVTVTCPECGAETEVPLTVDILFRG